MEIWKLSLVKKLFPRVSKKLALQKLAKTVSLGVMNDHFLLFYTMQQNNESNTSIDPKQEAPT